MTTNEMNEMPKLVIDSDEMVAPLVVTTWAGVRVSIGFVDEIHGRGALEVPGFTASRHELLILLKHWLKVHLDIGYWWFCFDQVGSSDMRQRLFAAKRAKRIVAALQLDDDEFKQIDTEVVAEFAKTYDSTWWRVFIGTATDEDRRQYEAEHKAMYEAAAQTPEEWAAVESEAFADRIAPRVDRVLDADRQMGAP